VSNSPFQGFKSPPFDFTEDRAEAIKAYIFSIKDKDMRFEIVPSDFVELYGNELKRFICALEGYRQSYTNPPMSMNYLINGLGRKDFAEHLKKVKLKSCMESMRLTLMKEPDWFNDVESFDVTDIGELFNYNYWFRWKEDEPEDYKEAWAYEIKPLDPDVRRKFKESVMYILPDSLDEVKEEEVLLSSSGSSCLKDTGDLRSSKVYKSKEVKNGFSSEPLRGKRSTIYVGPANYRDSIILSVEQSNSVKLIEKQAALACEKIKGSAYFKDRERLKRTLEKFRSKYRYFLDRDLTKEGITKNRELLQIIGECFMEKYPSLPCNKYWGIYDNFYLYVNDEWVQVPRGHGLGMANALTTIMQVAVFDMIVDAIYEIDVAHGEAGCLAFNDDETIGFTDEDDLENYWEVEDSVLNSLYLVRKDTKSYKGFHNIFCELYTGSMNRKKSYYMIEMYQVFAAPCIGMAKELTKSLSPWLRRGTVETYIQELRAFWGYEFYPDEWRYPASMGGWINPSFLGIRLDVLLLEESGLKEVCLQAYNACKVPLKKKEIGGRIFQTPLLKKYGPELTIPDEFKSFIDYMPTVKEVNCRYLKFNQQKSADRLYLSWQKKRIQVFEQKIDRCFDWRTIYKNIVDDYPFFDFLPPPCICKEEEIITEPKEFMPVRPFVPNPTLSLIKFFNRDKVSDNVIPYWKSQVGATSERKTLTVNERERVSTLGYLYRDGVSLQRYRYCNVKNHIDDFLIFDKDQWATATLHLTDIDKFLVPPVTKKLKITETAEDKRIDEILSSNLSEEFRILSEKVGYQHAIFIIDHIDIFDNLTKDYRPKEEYRDDRSFENQSDLDEDDLEMTDVNTEIISLPRWQSEDDDFKRKSVYFSYLVELDSYYTLIQSRDKLNEWGFQAKTPAEFLSPGALQYLMLSGGTVITQDSGNEIIWYPEWEVSDDSDEDPGLSTMFGNLSSDESDY
jgi:hypothetical protein